jgi:hypothetical protein
MLTIDFTAKIVSELSHLGLVSQETTTWGGCDLGGDGFWDEDYGWGVRVRRPFGARGMSSVRYGIRLGDLKENWFLCFPIKHSTHLPCVNDDRCTT